ncbi:hydantoinase B/oxoprolinase family protein, partial [Alphaproteobacteria bacterium]|nr:hydantoinase B/oxoprolinase family protein [Alphaproteobacteria bacterium]
SQSIGSPSSEIIQNTNVLIYGTTRATNAIITGKVAKTAAIFTKNFKDILIYRSGGKKSPFKLDDEIIPPYVPRHLTLEANERTLSEGDIHTELDLNDIEKKLTNLKKTDIESIGVCLIWSISNPLHEIKIGELIKSILPNISYTLSHQLNPVIREYPRASSTVIDASLKPLMQNHLKEIRDELFKHNFSGELLISSSSGGSMHVKDMIEKPIYMVKSGPAMAPIAGIKYSQTENSSKDVVIVDTGGTTFDVSLIRNGQIKYTQDTWLIEEFRGHNLGMSSVDIRSIGSGGGSIAWVDEGGLLKVGPKSAGAKPGPACYDTGGKLPTVTDAAVILGYIDPNNFLDGRMILNKEAALNAIEPLAQKLKMSTYEIAAAIITITSESMIKAIEEITVNEGVNPKESIIIAGGGAAGLNILPIANSLNCNEVIIPKTSGAISACGAQFSNIVKDFSVNFYTRTDFWKEKEIYESIKKIDTSIYEFKQSLIKRDIEDFKVEYFCQARYLNQQWEIEIPLPTKNSKGNIDPKKLLEIFNKTHKRLYGVIEDGATLECLSWKGRLTAKVEHPEIAERKSIKNKTIKPTRSQDAYFNELGLVKVPVFKGNEIVPETEIIGPSIIEEPTSTLVVYPKMSVTLTAKGNYISKSDFSNNVQKNDQKNHIDTVLLSVMSNRIDAITREMAITVLRSARSSVIAQSRDVSTAIVTADNQILATAEGLPAHIFGANLQTSSMMKNHPNFKEGDAFLHNDPYEGNSHAADVSVIVPVFYENEHMFSISVKGHQADIGNALPTTYMPQAKDVYEEGALIFPAVKVQENYKDINDIIRMCKKRIRVPDQWYGDYLSQIGAARNAEIKLKEFIKIYGKKLVKEFIIKWLDYSEVMCSNAIKQLPSGKLIAHGKHDPLIPFLPNGIELKIEISIDSKNGKIISDLRDNPDCLETGLNLTESTATCYGLQGIFNCLGNDIPTNSGSFRRIHVLLRNGCCVGIPKFPYSCSVATTNLGDVLVNMGQVAFTSLGEGYGLSEGNTCFGGAMGVISGKDWRNNNSDFINQIYLQGGGGPASAKSDGMNNLLIPVGAGLLYRDSIEVSEQKFPLIINTVELVKDSSGPGKFRGGLGTKVIFGPRKNKMTVSLLGGGKKYPPRGVLGGLDSKPSYNGIIKRDGSHQELEDAMMVELLPGEFICSIDSGGSGYGKPLLRDPDKVLTDVKEGYISIQYASTVYGVEIIKSNFPNLYKIDKQKTIKKRKELN